MTQVPSPARISLTDLSVLEPNVYEGRGSSVGLHRVVDQDGRIGLWKEYKDDVIAAMDGEQLVKLVRWPSTLSPRERERIVPHLALPWSVVMAGRRVVGVVMPEAPAHFSYRDRRGRTRPRTIDMLSNNRRSSRLSQSPFFEPPHRLALLGRLLILVSELHDSGVVIGDLQPQNILVSADPLAPAVMVLDCDSFWLDGRHAFGEPTDPETWRSPWMGSSFTNQTDLFKLALLVTRCMQEDNRDWYPNREVLTQFMPSHQVDRLEGLLAKEITVSAQQLRGLAGNWRSRVGNNGTLYNSTDAYLHAPWTPPAEDDPPWGTADGRAVPGPYGRPPASDRPGDRGPVPRNSERITGPFSMPPPMPPPSHVPSHFPPPMGSPAPLTRPPRPRPGPARQQVLAWLAFTVVVAGIVLASVLGGR